jgi:S-adenosylmethionine synthetase
MKKVVEIPFPGHPDRICDQFVEAIVDEYVKRDTASSLDLSVLASEGMVMIGGYAASKADFDINLLLKNVYQASGYTDDIEPFVNIEKATEKRKVSGAQGTNIVYGYATKETREMLPISLVHAEALVRRIQDLRAFNPSFGWMGPDGKVQVIYDGKTPEAVIVHVQHEKDMPANQVQMTLLEQAIVPVLGEHSGLKVYVNPSGGFSKGGLNIAAGASGRKVQASTYGGLLPSGGSIYFGKDPYKPSRAGLYMARHIAKQFVSEGLATNVLSKLVYVLGEPNPLLVEVIGGDGTDLSKLARERFDLRVEAIVEQFGLTTMSYQRFAAGNVFVDAAAPWERTQ